MVETVQWIDDCVVLIDQTRLPLEEVYVTCRSYQEVADAIRMMVVRGAPAIGVAAAMGVALGLVHASAEGLDEQFESICSTLAATRPTAVNLFWAIDRMRRLYQKVRGEPIAEIRRRLIERRDCCARKTSRSAAPLAVMAPRSCRMSARY
jgi:methylthioribose-1-phosphate isomerase